MKRINQIMAHPLYQYNRQKIEEAEADRIFCKHGLEHALDVARIIYIRVLEKNLPYQKDVVYAAALLHDIGRYDQYEKGILHHEAGALIARDILSECDFRDEEITFIIEAIRSHQKEEAGENIFNELLFWADKHSRNCFCCKAQEECYWDSEKKNQTILY